MSPRLKYYGTSLLWDVIVTVMDVVLFFLEHYPWLLVKENQQYIIKSLVNYFVYSGIFF